MITALDVAWRILVLVGFFWFVFLVARGKRPLSFEARRVQRSHRRIAPTSIRDVADNDRCHLVGVISSEPMLRAPLSGRPCVFYALTVFCDQDFRDGQRYSASPEIHERSGASFLLKDNTGTAIIDPSYAQLALVFEHQSELTYDHEAGTSRPTATDEQKAFLDRYSKSLSMGRRWRLRFHEAVIESGATVSVVGTGVRTPDLAAPTEVGYREPPSTLRLAGSAGAPLSIQRLGSSPPMASAAKE